MTLPEIQAETCPFSREITFWSASILILAGAAVDSMAERAFSPGLLLRAQVRRSSQSHVDEVTETSEILQIKNIDTFLSCIQSLRSVPFYLVSLSIAPIYN